jgi:hypothetical protein
MRITCGFGGWEVTGEGGRDGGRDALGLKMTARGVGRAGRYAGYGGEQGAGQGATATFQG